MSIIDKFNLFTGTLGSAGTPGVDHDSPTDLNPGVLSANVIDLLAAGHLGTGKPLWVNVLIKTAFNVAQTMTFSVYHHTTAAVGSGAALASGTTSQAAGQKCSIAIPPGVTVNRYIGVIASAAADAASGDYIAFLSDQPWPDAAIYPDGL